MRSAVGKVLIVDDEPAVRTALEVLFDVHGLCALGTGEPARALELVRDDDVGVIVQDMNFAGSETSGAAGIELFRAIRRLDPDLPVILMTAWASLETAVSLVKEGAADYVAKPWDDEKLVVTVQNLLAMRELRQDNLRLRAAKSRARAELEAVADLRGIVYESPRMHDAVTLAVKVAASDAPVLVTGPNGVGKEKIAEIIQASSRRRDRPFVKVNVGGLPDELLQAELFGAEAGAYTGATKLRVGRFEAAQGGTLFLDEIGNLSPAGQGKLLRVLQSGEYERLGSSTTRRADVRVVSATNVDLARAIATGAFREDLFFRLAVIEVRVPPLVERPEDVVPLAEMFLAIHARSDDGRRRLVLSAAARDALLAHEWPGNVRELENRIQRATLVAASQTVEPADLGLDSTTIGRTPATASRGAAAPPPASAEPTVPTAPTAEERRQLEDALRRAGGVVSRAAAELGLSRQALYRRMERHGLAVERKVRP